MDYLAHNQRHVLAQIEAACHAAGRAPESVRTIAVTKTVEPEVAGALFDLGCTDLGENRLPEFERKHAWFEAQGKRPRWHFIGHIQRNKARRIARLAHEIHSVDSLRLLEALQPAPGETATRPGLYLQLKLNPELNKGGLLPEELPAALEICARPGALPLLGLMTMAPLVEAERAQAEARRTFEQLASLAGELPATAFQNGQPLLSMGMSGDFEAAIQAGAQRVRIGSAFVRLAAPPSEESRN